MGKGFINNGYDGNMIISDTTVRTLLVKGLEEVERIKHLNIGEYDIHVNKKTEDIYEVKILCNVGDYQRR